MKLIKPEMFPINTPSQSKALALFEASARTAYQSFDKQKEGSAKRLLSYCLGAGHESTIEHINFSVRFVTSRGVTHELVRHRLASFTQESTRYVRYEGEIEVIEPYWLQAATADQRYFWENGINAALHAYQFLLKEGLTPQAARGVLPNDLKTEIVMTANLREWRHILSLRLAKAAHPDMRILMQILAQYLMTHLPLFFQDLEVIKHGYHEVL